MSRLSSYSSVLVVLSTISRSSFALAAQSSTHPADPAERNGPVHRITFGDARIAGMDYSPDGKTLYVLLNDQAINLWELLVYHWPELVGALVACLVPLVLLALRRAKRRRRQIPGEPHCRKCNYCLKSCSGNRCPECGRPLAHLIIGRPPWRWTVPVATAAVVLTFAYAALIAARAPRKSRVGDWIECWSFDLLDWAKRRNISWVVARAQNADRILAVDVASGQTLRTIFRQASWSSFFFQLRAMPDGSGLLLPLKDGDQLGLISPTSGRVLQTLRHHDAPVGKSSRWLQVAGFDDAGQAAYVVVIDRAAQAAKLVSWDPKRGQMTPLLERPLDPASNTGWPGDWNAPRYYRIPGMTPPRFLELPGRAHWFSGRQTRADLLIRDPALPDQPVLRFSSVLDSWDDPQFSSDGSRVLLGVNTFTEDWRAFDLITGAALGRIGRAPDGAHGYEQCGDVPRNRLIVAARSTRFRVFVGAVSKTTGFFVRDLAAGCWIGRYSQPEDWWCSSLCASPDSRWFAAAGGVQDKRRTPAKRNELQLYDLTTLPHDDLPHRNFDPLEPVRWLNDVLRGR